jgi:DMSO/TMAO reductase YedYZ molybdopterin-dependent catalytic subunit
MDRSADAVLFGLAGPCPGIMEVLLHAADGYTDAIALEKAMDPTTLALHQRARLGIMI